MSQFIGELADYVKRKQIDIEIISSSSQVDLEAPKYGLQPISLSSRSDPDVVFDSADEVDEQFNLLKGGGAALLREKVLHHAGRKTVILIEEDKMVSKLGTKHPLPIEVLPFALPVVKRDIENKLGYKSDVRMSSGKVGPLITDNGNCILDIQTGPIEDPVHLDRTLGEIPGVLGTGLFHGLKGVLIIGGEKSAQTMRVDADSTIESGGR